MSTKTDQLIRDFRLELVSPACHPGAPMWSGKACLEDDISDVLPYLNAIFEKVNYYHSGKVLILNKDGKRYAFRSHEIAFAPCEDRKEAEQLGAEIITIANDIWNRRHEIEPDYSGKTPPNVLTIYKLLPGTNCKECGCPTCTAYAAALREGTKELAACIPLSMPEHTANREQLLGLL